MRRLVLIDRVIDRTVAGSNGRRVGSTQRRGGRLLGQARACPLLPRAVPTKAQSQGQPAPTIDLALTARAPDRTLFQHAGFLPSRRAESNRRPSHYEEA